MPLTESRDFILSKNAYYFDEGSIQQSGCLVVTAGRIMLNVIQTVDPVSEYGDGLVSLKDSISKIKRDIKAIGEYGRRKKEIIYYASISPSIEEFERTVTGRGSLNAKSLNIPWDDVASYSTGFFFGLKLKLKDGRARSISTMRLGAIKRFLTGRVSVRREK
ncbi:MAG: hypothetical protein KA369_20150 [Spirochaetes bacterium]|nr:hypothetical protein [Spirochaetota bacterium]